jgi:predicted nucleic acid-binding Zn ribbon protein
MPQATCPICGNPVPPQPGAGQPRKYCNAACKMKAYRQRERERKRRVLSQRPPKRGE